MPEGGDIPHTNDLGPTEPVAPKDPRSFTDRFTSGDKKLVSPQAGEAAANALSRVLNSLPLETRQKVVASFNDGTVNLPFLVELQVGTVAVPSSETFIEEPVEVSYAAYEDSMTHQELAGTMAVAIKLFLMSDNSPDVLEGAAVTDFDPDVPEAAHCADRANAPRLSWDEAIDFKEAMTGVINAAREADNVLPINGRIMG